MKRYFLLYTNVANSLADINPKAFLVLFTTDLKKKKKSLSISTLGNSIWKGLPSVDHGNVFLSATAIPCLLLVL